MRLILLLVVLLGFGCGSSDAVVSTADPGVGGTNTRGGGTRTMLDPGMAKFRRYAQLPLPVLVSTVTGGPAPTVGAAPASFWAGQSNQGNQDEVPGTFDARVSVVYSNSYSPTTFYGPATQALQKSNPGDTPAGHSFEWQCASDMAAHYNSNIIVGKYWADGTSIDLWTPGNVLWPQLATALENFALRCVAANVSQVEFYWAQGESNTPNNVSSLLATFQSLTNDVFDSVKYLLEGFGLTVHITIIKTNPNIVTGGNASDPSASSLTAIRGYQDALAIARTDTSTIDFPDITPATGGGVHYAHGQTNVCGSRIATAQFARYTGTQPAFTTPPTIEQIMGSAVLFDLDARSITGLANNAVVATNPDISGNGRDATYIGSAQPLYKTAAFTAPSGVVHPSVLFDGVDDRSQAIPGVTLPAPGTTPFISFWIGRQVSWTLNDRIWGATSNYNLSLYQSDSTPKLTVANTTANDPGVAGPAIGAFVKVENKFSNNAGDYIQIAETRTSTGSLGNTAPGAIAEAQTNNSGFGNVERVRWFGLNATPTKIQRDKLRGNLAKNYGLAVCGST